MIFLVNLSQLNDDVLSWHLRQLQFTVTEYNPPIVECFQQERNPFVLTLTTQ
jgi:hypothetical protein